MYAQSAKTPTPRESVTITLTAREFAFIQGMIYARSFLNHQESDEFKVFEANNINFVDRLKKKLDYFQPNIGDACATPAHIPEAPGQGGTITCHLCEGRGSYIKLNSSKFSECEWCRGSGIGLRSVEGGNQ